MFSAVGMCEQAVLAFTKVRISHSLAYFTLVYKLPKAASRGPIASTDLHPV